MSRTRGSTFTFIASCRPISVIHQPPTPNSRHEDSISFVAGAAGGGESPSGPERLRRYTTISISISSSSNSSQLWFSSRRQRRQQAQRGSHHYVSWHATTTHYLPSSHLAPCHQALSHLAPSTAEAGLIATGNIGSSIPARFPYQTCTHSTLIIHQY